MQTAKRARKPDGVRQAKTRYTVVVEDTRVSIPGWVTDLDSFRRWTDSDEVPEKLRAYFLDGEVLVDLSREELFSHNQVKSEFLATLTRLIKKEKLGRYVSEGMLLTNDEANLGARPDAAFISHECMRSGRLRLAEQRDGDFSELQGSPDMALEIVSNSSVEKDTRILRDLYGRAAIPEYWIVDARAEEVAFDILRLSARGYTRTRKDGLWVKSAVFGKSFRLTRETAEDGFPDYTLDVR